MQTENYIQERLENQIKWYSQKSRSAQGWHKKLKIVEFICAATIPFLAGLAAQNLLIFQVAIGAAGLTVAVITALQGLYQWQEHWVLYRSTAESLKREKYLFLTGNAPYDSDDESSNFKQLVCHVEGLLSSENGSWARATRVVKKEKLPANK